MLKAPFPWFGGKSKAARLIWSRFGDVRNYVEPFLGSAAVWLGRPKTYAGWAVLNDLDGNVSNFWRAMQADPDAVAAAADWPVSECDLHARHLWLVRNLPALAGRLMADPEYFEARTAGWWAWGACCWIGGGWCAGDGPWTAQPDSEGVPSLVCGDARGVKKGVPNLGNGGKGINKPSANLLEWFRALQASLRPARITCGDWERVCSTGTITFNGMAGVLLDPPYSQTEAVYAHDSSTVAHDVRAWCLANGENKQLRIALCGHAGEHEELLGHGWTVETWGKGGGYQGADDRERIFFSPACVKKEADMFYLPLDTPASPAMQGASD